jgi:predicted double-glycine peptidase
VAIVRLPKRPRIDNLICLIALILVILCIQIERREDWAWTLLPYLGTEMVFFTNLSLESVVILFVLLWRDALTRQRQYPVLRTLLFCLPLLCISLLSYKWYFEPLPVGIHGVVDRAGICRQTTDDSCSAASAVMLLHQQKIVATESEMADLCLTRSEKGTSLLGLYRGLAIKAASGGLRPQVVRLGTPERLLLLKQPAILNVGLKSDTPPDIAKKMQGYGWNFGSWHTIFLLKTDPNGKAITVFDPSNGKERWPIEGLEYIWDGNALILTRE